MLLHFNKNDQDVLKDVNHQGQMPLPPYIKRNEKNESDDKDYQTIFAEEDGAVAAPTAGLHFTDELINILKSKGVLFAPITLHVGAGTFLPVKVTNLTTGRPVRVWHSDFGVYDSEDVNVDGFSQSDVPGYNDCVWQPNEKLSFAYDMLAYGDDLSDIDDEKTFELNLKYDLNSIRGKYGQEIIEDDETGFSYYESFDRWNSELIYSKNDF